MKYDEIGYWSEIKLEIIKKYAGAYSKILSNQKVPCLYHIYIDAFAGAGKHISKTTGEWVEGSPMKALNVIPPFKEYHFIDLDKRKIQSLHEIAGEKNNIFIYEEDCNKILLNKIFPKVKYQDYKRALCLLDPYGLHLNWDIIFTAGQMRSIEIFLNFPVADMNRNVLWKDSNRVEPKQIQRMNNFWGDQSWKTVAYRPSKQLPLFGEPDNEKMNNEGIVEAFRERLINVAGFRYVPKPLAMRNSMNAVVYYLFFASQKPVADNIITDIFNKYRNGVGNTGD